MTQVGLTSKSLPVTIMANALGSESPFQGKQAPGALYKAWTCSHWSLGGAILCPQAMKSGRQVSCLRNSTPPGRNDSDWQTVLLNHQTEGARQMETLNTTPCQGNWQRARRFQVEG